MKKNKCAKIRLKRTATLSYPFASYANRLSADNYLCTFLYLYFYDYHILVFSNNTVFFLTISLFLFGTLISTFFKMFFKIITICFYQQS